MKRSVFIICLVVFCLMSYSCVRKNIGIDTAEESLILVDYEGRSVSIPRNVDSVIVMSDAFLEYCIQVCPPDKIIAIDSKSKKNESFLLSFKAYPQLSDLPVVGSVKDPNYEKIIELDPDVIIIKSSGNQADIIQEKTGIPVFSTRMVDGIDFEAYSIMGKILNEEEVGKKKQADLEKTYEKIKALSSDIPEKQKKSAYFAINTTNKSYTNTMVNLVGLSLCGGINVAQNVTNANEWGICSITPESILEWNPDFFFIDMPISESSLTLEDVKNDSLLSVLDSVTEENLHYAFLSFDMPKNTVRVLAEVLYNGQIIHPDIFGSDEVKKLFDDLAKNYYGKTWDEMR